MEQVYQVKTLSMGWCLECHRDPAPQLRPVEFVTDMNWLPDEDARDAGPASDERKRHLAFDGLLDMSSLEREPEQQCDDSLRWRSLDELADAPRFRAFLEAEFPAEADPGGINRRRWLQLMGASLALAAVGGCRWKEQEILPFAERPEGRMPGKTERFATAMPLGDTVVGLGSHLRRRPAHQDRRQPAPSAKSWGNGCFCPGRLLELYDPDRSRSVTLQNGERRQEKTWEQFAEVVPSTLPAIARRTAGADSACWPRRTVRRRWRRCDRGC